MPEWKPEILRRLAPLRLAPTREAEIAEELAQHLEDRYQELLALGITDEEARCKAMEELKGEDLLACGLRPVERDLYREPVVWGKRTSNLFAGILQDIRYALRMLRKSPGFTAVAVLTLALGIGVNTSVFSLIYSLAIRPLPIKDASSLVSLYQDRRGKSYARGVKGSPYYISYPEYLNYRDRNHVFSGLAAYSDTTLSLGGADPQSLAGLLVSCNYFEVLKADFAVGRDFGPSDCATSGLAQVAVLSNSFWQRKLGGDLGVIGENVTLNGQIFTVVGIASPQFSGTELQVPDVWVPIAMAPQLMPDWFATRDWLALGDVSWLHVVGLLKPGVSRRQAQAELAVLARQMDANYPGRQTILIVNSGAFLNNPEMRSDGVWFGAGLFLFAGLILLMACTNVANLLLSRAAARQQEVVVRLALGASRHRLVCQLLTETALLAVLGGAAGLLVMLWLTPILVGVLPEMPSASLTWNSSTRLHPKRKTVDAYSLVWY
jgi:predicted permease